MTVNPLKTSDIMFSHKFPKSTSTGTNINGFNSIEYLGAHIDKKLNFVKQGNSTINKQHQLDMLYIIC